MLKGLRKDGTFLLNTIWNEEELDKNLPAKIKRYIYQNNIKFYIINATQIAEEIGLGGRINMIMQSVFFKLANIIPIEDAVKHLKISIESEYGDKGEKVVNMNYAAVDKGIAEIKKINALESWRAAVDDEKETEIEKPDFIKNILEPMNRQEGDSLPVSAFLGEQKVRGEIPSGTSGYEKRGVAVKVPSWKIENCIQCNQCSLVCPHASIRPFLLDAEEEATKPEAFETKKQQVRVWKNIHIGCKYQH